MMKFRAQLTLFASFVNIFEYFSEIIYLFVQLVFRSLKAAQRCPSVKEACKKYHNIKQVFTIKRYYILYFKMIIIGAPACDVSRSHNAQCNTASTTGDEKKFK
jgi:hypothetical protein